MDQADQIRQHITEGNTRRALRLLRDSTKRGSQKHRDAILLSSRFTQWERDQRVGISSSDTTRRQIERAILDILDDDYTITQSSPPPAGTNYRMLFGMVMGPLGIGIGIGLLVFFLTKDQPVKPAELIGESGPIVTDTIPVVVKDDSPTKVVEPTAERLLEVPTTLSPTGEPTATDPVLRHPDELITTRVRFVLMEDNGGRREILRMNEFGGWARHNEDGLALGNYTETARKGNYIYLQDIQYESEYVINLKDSTYQLMKIPVGPEARIIGSWHESPVPYIKSIAYKNELGIETYLIKQLLGGWKLRKGMLVPPTDQSFEQIDTTQHGLLLQKSGTDELWSIDVIQRTISVKTGQGPYRERYQLSGVY